MQKENELDIRRFVSDYLLEGFNSINDEDVVDSIDKGDDLGYTEWTYVFHAALLFAVVRYNRENHNRIYIVPEAGGKMPTDFTLRNENQEDVLKIEHENCSNRFEHNFSKLCASKASNNLLIWYEDDKNTIKDKMNQIKKCQLSNMYLLTGKDDGQNRKENFSLTYRNEEGGLVCQNFNK